MYYESKFQYKFRNKYLANFFETTYKPKVLNIALETDSQITHAVGKDPIKMLKLVSDAQNAKERASINPEGLARFMSLMSTSRPKLFGAIAVDSDLSDWSEPEDSEIEDDDELPELEKTFGTPAKSKAMVDPATDMKEKLELDIKEIDEEGLNIIHSIAEEFSKKSDDAVSSPEDLSNYIGEKLFENFIDKLYEFDKVAYDNMTYFVSKYGEKQSILFMRYEKLLENYKLTNETQGKIAEDMFKKEFQKHEDQLTELKEKMRKDPRIIKAFSYKRGDAGKHLKSLVENTITVKKLQEVNDQAVVLVDTKKEIHGTKIERKPPKTVELSTPPVKVTKKKVAKISGVVSISEPPADVSIKKSTEDDEAADEKEPTSEKKTTKHHPLLDKSDKPFNSMLSDTAQTQHQIDAIHKHITDNIITEYKHNDIKSLKRFVNSMKIQDDPDKPDAILTDEQIMKIHDNMSALLGEKSKRNKHNYDPTNSKFKTEDKRAKFTQEINNSVERISKLLDVDYATHKFSTEPETSTPDDVETDNSVKITQTFILQDGKKFAETSLKPNNVKRMAEAIEFCNNNIRNDDGNLVYSSTTQIIDALKTCLETSADTDTDVFDKGMLVREFVGIGEPDETAFKVVEGSDGNTTVQFSSPEERTKFRDITEKLIKRIKYVLKQPIAKEVFKEVSVASMVGSKIGSTIDKVGGFFGVGSSKATSDLDGYDTATEF